MAWVYIHSHLNLSPVSVLLMLKIQPKISDSLIAVLISLLVIHIYKHLDLLSLYLQFFKQSLISLIAITIFLFVILIFNHFELPSRISIVIDQQAVKVELPKHMPTELKEEHKQTSSRYPKPSQRLVEMYKRQAASRQQYLQKTDKSKYDFSRIYNNMAPEVFCPELVKVGKTDDGGKWMCGPFDLPNNCTIFSLGMDNDISFEKDIQTITEQRCRIFSFDTKQQNAETKNLLRLMRAQAMAVKITKASNPDNGEYTLSDLMGMHMVDKIEILKIDIEKSEFAVMEDFLKKHQVSQILIEVHGSPQQTLDFLRMLSRKGYLIFHFDINGEYHNLCEYSFIHESVLDRYGATLLAKFLT